MEILIPGLLLVALMVYLSTKIKKKAAKAYEREIFVGKGFSVIKPEGFISPTEIGELAFAAYSKEFGSDDCENLRRVSAEARIFYGKTLEDVVHQRLGTLPTTGGAKPFVEKERIIEREEAADGCAYSAIYKFIEGEEAVTYELAIRFLPDQKDEFLPKINEMLDTFRLEG